MIYLMMDYYIAIKSHVREKVQWHGEMNRVDLY